MVLVLLLLLLRMMTHNAPAEAWLGKLRSLGRSMRRMVVEPREASELLLVGSRLPCQLPMGSLASTKQDVTFDVRGECQYECGAVVGLVGAWD